MLRRALILVVLFLVVPCFAQNGVHTPCTLAGTWYGGSVVAYQLTIVPTGPAGLDERHSDEVRDAKV